MVRLRIFYGATLFGDIDVELFDQARPITVSNFLAYVKSGRYYNSFLHRLLPNFIVQGGEWTISSPYSGEVVQTVSRVPTFAPIPNEFASGPLLSNVYGTIAMAKLENEPDSATASWFINLTNNAALLDNQNVGFTVFGQIRRGFQYLDYFKRLSEDNGILNMSRPEYPDACPPFYLNPDGFADYPFSDLPVQFTGFFDCPYYNDLFRVQTILLSEGDIVAPKLTIVSPRTDGSLTNEVVIAGTFSENKAMGAIRIYRDTNNPVVATMTTNGLWSVTLENVPPGTNTIVVEAVDEAGNLSGIAQRFFYSVPEPLNLQVNGNGVVSGPTDGQVLELGRGYTLKATPAPGNLFAGWTGLVPQFGTTYPFIMETDTSITATFVTNLFPTVKGTYTGLFFNPDRVEQQGSGFLTLTVADFGAYSAKLSMNGKTYPFRGAFSPYGKETNLVTRPGTNDLVLRLSLDLTEGTGLITGSINPFAVNTNLDWSATVVAERNVIRPANQPASEAGKYTFLLPGDTSTSAGPPGDSFGTVNVTTKGSVTLSGSLDDGTKVVQKASLSPSGAWPLYLSLYKGKGALIGWVFFADEPTTDFTGLLNWFKQPQANARYYPGGFTNEAPILGSRFVAPTAATRLIELTDATVAFTDSVFAEDFANSVSIDAAGKVTNPDGNRLSLNISKASGLFTGSVTPPTSPRALSFKGAVLQKQNRGAGFFLNPNSSGAVNLGGE